MAQQAQPIQPTMPLSVTLEAQQWNNVLAALAEAPYRVAAPLIQAISDQLQRQAGAVPSTAAVSNGEARAS